MTIRPVDGGSGPFDPTTDDASEASLDTQMSLGTAPGAKETLYDMPVLTDADIMAGYTAVDEDNNVDVVSSSFGECELDFTAAYNGGTDFTSILKTFHAVFQQGNAQGITFWRVRRQRRARLRVPDIRRFARSHRRDQFRARSREPRGRPERDGRRRDEPANRRDTGRG